MESNRAYKIGDTVKIKSRGWFNNLTWDDRASIPFGFNYNMKEYCGKVAKIVYSWKIYGTIGYNIDIDGGKWAWNDYMFEKESCVYDVE